MKDGEQLKLSGMDVVESNSLTWVQRMRVEAIALSVFKGEVTADDLRRFADETKDQPHHPNAWGSIFRKEFECVGRRNSTYKSNHAREIKVWRWVA